METLSYCCVDDQRTKLRTREATDAKLATQCFALAICVDFNDLYFILGMCIGIPELLVYGGKVLTTPASVPKSN
jgi:hypothetical protein